EGLAFADRALRGDSEGFRAWLERARCLIVLARWEDALAAAERAAAAAPDDPDALQQLLIAQTRLGLTERAAATQAPRQEVQRRPQETIDLGMELESRPDDPEIRWKMGRLAAEAGSLLSAYRCFEAALALDPEYRPAREGLTALKAAHPELARGPAPSVRPRG